MLVLACGDSSSSDDAADFSGTDVSTSLTTSATTTVSTTVGDSTDTTAADGASTSDDPDDSGTTFVETCPDTHVCLAAPPEGWHGPVVRLQRPTLAPVPECPEAYPLEVVEAGVDVIADPATCSCTCGAADDVECESSTHLQNYGTDDACVDATPLSFEVFATACNIFPAIYPGFTRWTLDPVLVQGGACEPGVVIETTEPVFATALTACGGAETIEGCQPDHVCTPHSGDELCIWQEGDARCPAAYENRFVYYGTVDDTRDCEACTCSEPVGLCEGVSAILYSGICNVPVSGVIAGDGECHETSADQTRSAAVQLGTPSAFCMPSPSAPLGEVTGATPTTVCCAET